MFLLLRDRVVILVVGTILILRSITSKKRLLQPISMESRDSVFFQAWIGRHDSSITTKRHKKQVDLPFLYDFSQEVSISSVNSFYAHILWPWANHDPWAQPSTQAFSSRSHVLARNFVTSPNGISRGPRSVTSRHFVPSRVEWAGGERLGTSLSCAMIRPRSQGNHGNLHMKWVYERNANFPKYKQ